MSADLFYLIGGIGLLLAVVLPVALSKQAVSAPMVLLLVGAAVGLTPIGDGEALVPQQHPALAEHLTELCVVVSLMGVGLALDRPLGLRPLSGWFAWRPTWRLLFLAMPLCILAVTLLGSALLGLTLSSALLLAASLAPTDPVLASDVQVEGPTTIDDEPEDDIDERNEVRFALTSEAGLNDGLAFPFVAAALLLGSSSAGSLGWVEWLAWDLVGKVVLGALVGVAVGWALARITFHAPRRSLRLAETGEPLLAVAAVLLSYGVAEALHVYGFLAVFACAMTIRAADRTHNFHSELHGTVERFERLLTVAVLLLLGVSLTNGLLDALTWQGALVGCLLVFVVRPLTGVFSLWVGSRGAQGPGGLSPQEQLVTAFFGVRGVGSLFYIAYATSHADIAEADTLWAVVAFTVALSVLVHGMAATPIMRHLGPTPHKAGSTA